MVFVPFVVDSDDTHVTVDIHRMQMSEAEQTNHIPPWQTSWTDEAAKNIFFTYLR